MDSSDGVASLGGSVASMNLGSVGGGSGSGSAVPADGSGADGAFRREQHQVRGE